MRETKVHIDDGWRIPDELWSRIQPLLPAKRPHSKRADLGLMNGRSWMASFRCCAPAANGKLSLGSLAPPALSMTVSNSGGKRGSSRGCGKRDSLSMTP
jgi:hypothetical protein